MSLALNNRVSSVFDEVTSTSEAGSSACCNITFGCKGLDKFFVTICQSTFHGAYYMYQVRSSIVLDLIKVN